MKHRKEVTIYDLAKDLNVSPSTVSRALKGHHSIGPGMIEAVKKLAKDRGYRPNSIAASLRNNKTNTLGVMVSWINRNFISSLISGIEEVARPKGYNVVISQSHDSFKNEVINARTLYNSRIGGLVVSLAMETNSYDHFQQFIDKGIPLVFVDRVPESFDSDKVIIDNFAAGFQATQHLIDQGCLRIAHFAGAQHRNVYKQRMDGYLAALHKNGLEIDESLIIRGEVLSAEEGHEMTTHLLTLPNPPDAIFSPNDTSAVSAIQVAKRRGLHVPRDLAVIGFNNDPISLIIDPPLSTMDHPAVNLGKIAARQIFKQEENKDIITSETITLRTQLIIRESSMRKNL